MQVSDTTVAHKQEDERHNHSASARAHIHTHARTHTHAQVMHGQPSLQPTDTPLMPRILAAMSSKSTLSTLFSCPRTGPLNCHEGGRKERSLGARNGNEGGGEVQCYSQVPSTPERLPRWTCRTGALRPRPRQPGPVEGRRMAARLAVLQISVPKLRVRSWG